MNFCNIFIGYIDPVNGASHYPRDTVTLSMNNINIQTLFHSDSLSGLTSSQYRMNGGRLTTRFIDIGEGFIKCIDLVSALEMLRYSRSQSNYITQQDNIHKPAILLETVQLQKTFLNRVTQFMWLQPGYIQMTILMKIIHYYFQYTCTQFSRV